MESVVSRKRDRELGILRVDLRIPMEGVAFTMDGVHFEAEWPDHTRPIEIVDPYDAVTDLGDLVRDD